MTDLLIKFFIDPKSTKSRMRKQYGNLSSLVGILVNILLAAGKMVIGALSGSIAILGDGINNLFDSGSAIISLISFQIASKPADAKHPFGHARFEYISSSLVAMLILYVAITLFRESVNKIIKPQDFQLEAVGILVLIISMLIKFWLYRFYKKIGNRINSDLILANATDSISDVLATGAILVALVLSPIVGINLDGPMGLVVSLIIFRSAIEILSETFNHLMGNAPSREEVKALEEVLLSYEGILGVHDMIIHDYGPGRKFVTVHLEVDARVDIIDSHELIDRIERDVEKEEGFQLTIHMDPLLTDDSKTNRLKEFTQRLVEEIDENYSVHDFRIIHSDRSTNLVFDVLVPASDKESDREIEEKIRKRIAREDAGLLPVIEIDRDYL